jgi:excisionase family DNA binding protein
VSTATAVPRLRVADAARKAGLAESTIRSLFDKGVLTGIRSETGYRLIDIDSLDRYRENRYLSVSQAAHRLGLSEDAITKLFDAGELAGHRSPAGHRLIDPAPLS